jgi:hypothetical protein
MAPLFERLEDGLERQQVGGPVVDEEHARAPEAEAVAHPASIGTIPPELDRDWT